MLFLSEADHQALLRLAREAIVQAVCHGRLAEQIPQDGIFAERQALFVSLHVGSRLRGCIGTLEPERLGDAIVRCAISAASQDPRFSPMLPKELELLRIEISLLSAPIPISVEQIEIGRHGLLVCCGGQRGVLLPQVAVHHGFTSIRFLEETCRKAQLSLQAWKEPETQVFGFTCEVLSEPDLAADSGAIKLKRPRQTLLGGA
jgi:AmmeMemoRadiSam system protein A